MTDISELIENLENSGSRSEVELHEDRIDAAEELRNYQRGLAELEQIKSATRLEFFVESAIDRIANAQENKSAADSDLSTDGIQAHDAGSAKGLTQRLFKNFGKPKEKEENAHDPEYFSGTAADGCTWRIKVIDVVTDMLAHEEDDDKWPLPISRQMANQWLSDNSDTIEGWELMSIPTPKAVGFTKIV